MKHNFDVFFQLKRSHKDILQSIKLHELKNLVEKNNRLPHQLPPVPYASIKEIYDLLELNLYENQDDLKFMQVEVTCYIFWTAQNC